jgi:PII-like signaling protein
MKIPSDGKLLRIFIGESDKWQGKPLYQEIIRIAREKKMAGATAVKGFMGFGCKSHMHMAKFLRLSEDLPVIIEIVDSDDKVSEFIGDLDEMVQEGLITTEKINVIMYSAPTE